MATIKEQKIAGVGQDVQKLEPLVTLGRNIKWCSHYGKIVWAVLKKIKNRNTVRSSNPTTGYISKEKNKAGSQRDSSLQYHPQ